MTPPRDLHDYISPGFKAIRLDDYFPNLIAGEPSDCTRPHMRRDTPHIAYHDRRAPDIDLLNRDEAHLLYNTALRFVGANALEIGCSIGWSACHMAAAGVTLDVVDPLLGADWMRRTVAESLTGVGVLQRVRLHAAASPDAVDVLGSGGRRWSLMFIDGDHQFPAPVRDAVACERWPLPMPPYSYAMSTYRPSRKPCISSEIGAGKAAFTKRLKSWRSPGAVRLFRWITFRIQRSRMRFPII